MPHPIRFRVQMNKITKDRPRVTFRGTHTTQKTIDAENDILVAYRAAGGGFHGPDVPIQIDFVAHIHIPCTLKGKVKPGDFAIQKSTNKDKDNIDKLIADALMPPKNILALADKAADGGKDLLSGYAYRDDVQVCAGKQAKFWTDGPTRIDIVLTPWPDMNEFMGEI